MREGGREGGAIKVYLLAATFRRFTHSALRYSSPVPLSHALHSFLGDGGCGAGGGGHALLHGLLATHLVGAAMGILMQGRSLFSPSFSHFLPSV